MNKFYTGVGSRETPADTLNLMQKIATRLVSTGHILRSGGATGADSAFEFGCDSYYQTGRKEIYLATDKILPQCYQIAEEIHPAWHRCSDYAKKLHARNCYQVLGADLQTPSDFLVCWTRNGELVGGTRTAIVLATSRNIPVYNLAIEQQMRDLVTLIKSFPVTIAPLEK